MDICTVYKYIPSFVICYKFGSFHWVVYSEEIVPLLNKYMPPYHSILYIQQSGRKSSSIFIFWTTSGAIKTLNMDLIFCHLLVGVENGELILDLFLK